MTSFLIEYHRGSGDVKLTPYTGDQGRILALRQRMKADLARPTGSDVEFVVIEAKDEAAIRRTHRRYFESFKDLSTAHEV